jgi:hypothetical protein
MARIASAQPVDTIDLRVTPDASGCITEAALRARIASLRVQVADPYGLAFTVDASSEPAVVVVRRNDVVIARRRFDDLPERCADRVQTIALVITLAIEHAITPEDQDIVAPEEPEAAAAPEAPPVESVPNADAAQPVASTSDDDEAEQHQTERPEPTLRAIVGAGAAYGLLPEVAGLLALGVELPSAGLRIGLGALVSSETSTSLAGGTALTRLAGARAYGCASAEGRAFELQGCAGVAFGVVSGRGRDYAPGADATATLLAPLLRLGARYPAHGTFAVGLAFEGFAHLVRPQLQVSGNGGAVSSAALFGASLALEGVLAVP